MNSGTLADYTRSIAPSLNRSLVETGYLRRIESLAVHFPSRLAGIFGFEVHLADPSGRADFAFKISNDEAIKESLHSVLLSLQRSSEDKGWRAWLDFSGAWRRSDSRFCRDVADIWLEFDIDPSSSHLPVPSLFVTVRPSLGRDGVSGLFRDIVRHFRGTAFLGKLEPCLGRCLDGLPQNASIPFIGLMLSRPAPAVRLSVSKLLPEQIPRYLQDLQWPGDDGALRRVLDLPRAGVTDLLLDLDVGETLLPKAGLEFYFRESRLPARPFPWEGFLETLAAKNLCHPAQRDALLCYPGQAKDADKPLNLVMAERFLNHHQSVFVRKMSHFKLVFGANRDLAAKAYLEARLYWVAKGRQAGPAMPAPTLTPDRTDACR